MINESLPSSTWAAPRALTQVHARSRVHTLIFHVCWIAIVIWAARERFSLPVEPLVDKDVWGYLGPALTKISGGSFVQIEGRGFLYPGFLYLVLSAVHSFGAITIVQHTLGLATGLLLFGNWLKSRRFLSRPFIPLAVHDAAGLGLLAFYLLGAQSIVEEHYLRAESILPFFVILGFGFTIRFLLAKHIDHQPRRALGYGAAALAVSFILPLLKPSYALSSILTTLPVWWHLFDRREPWKGRLAMVSGPVLAAWVLLWAPESRYASADPRSANWLSASIFVIHAPQIRDQMASDLHNGDATVPYPREQLQSILTLLDTEIELSRPRVRHTFASLGFHPDYLLYSDSFCSKLKSILPDHAAQADFYRYYFRRTWLRSPGSMLHKFFTQLGLFYGLECPVYDLIGTNFARNYRDAFQILSEPLHCYHIISQVPAATQYVASLPALAGPDLGAPQPRVIEALLPAFARSYLPGLMLAIAAFTWLAFKSEICQACGRLATIVSVGYAYNFGNSVAIASLHTLGVGRYSHVQLVTTLLTQALSLWLVIEVIAATIQLRRIKSTSPRE